MVKKILETSMAVALAVKMCKPAVVPIYPITPQTHIVEHIAKFVNDGEMDAEVIDMESEHSSISAAMGASATGVRTFTATSSQGLALMNEILYVVSGMRLPVVMAVSNRSLSAPINIWNDHQDSISVRDSGWIQLYVESAQEAFDTTLMAYKIAEDKNVLLPVMVCMDGFTLSHVHEQVDLPNQNEANQFLGNFKANYVTLDSKKPVTLGPVSYPDTFMEFKEQQQEAIQNALKIIEKINSEFTKKFKRSYGNGLVETYKISDADTAIVLMGSACSTARAVVDELRKKGQKIGVIKIKSFRPFPCEEIKKICKNIKKIAVIDRDISVGNEGALFSEIKSCLYGQNNQISGFIAGLGGRDITPKHIKKAVLATGKNDKVIWLK